MLKPFSEGRGSKRRTSEKKKWLIFLLEKNRGMSQRRWKAITSKGQSENATKDHSGNTAKYINKNCAMHVHFVNIQHLFVRLICNFSPGPAGFHTGPALWSVVDGKAVCQHLQVGKFTLSVFVLLCVTFWVLYKWYPAWYVKFTEMYPPK